MDRASYVETDDSGKAMSASLSPKTICYSSESSSETNFNTCKCNNNIGDCDVSDKNGDINALCVCLKENSKDDGNVSVEDSRESHKQHHSGKRKSLRKKNKRKKESEGINGTLTPTEEEYKSSETSSEHNFNTVGGDEEEKRQERLRCRQHELNTSSNEINRADVTTSCDLTSNSVIKFKSESCDEESNQNKKVYNDCPTGKVSSCSVFQSTCSEGSYSRRKHHKHHKHKRRSNSPEDNTAISPKVNPIFLWVRQEDTKIVEVFCEDYDHRNRLRLTRTHLGWRAIPKTKTFAEAIIPKAVPKESTKDTSTSEKPKKVKKSKKRKKGKKKKKPKTILSDNPNKIKECSVALYRDDLADYKSKTLISGSVESVSPEENTAVPAESESNQNQSRPSSPESIPECVKSSSETRKLVKSHSCVFPSSTKASKRLSRSISLDLNIDLNTLDLKVQDTVSDVREADSAVTQSEVAEDIKSEVTVEKNDLFDQALEIEVDSPDVAELDGSENQRNHSESVLLDMTKHDLDFNDADCDELGQLLKDIPDLEFVEEEELEEIDEEEEWLKPTDLRVQKSAAEHELPGVNLPASITPVVTVTSTAKQSEPLAAPLPEVTITPISKPKPAHQQKPQNNFLESLLSSSGPVKPENYEANGAQKKHAKSLKFSSSERKGLKHFQESNMDCQVRNKRLKTEDITLKNLLSKQQSGRQSQPTGVETCIQRLKSFEGEECSTSRLQELLTQGVNSDPIMQLKEVLSNPLLSVPDPLLVPRARLPALVASPASEIPRLLSMHLEKNVEETLCPPIPDSDILEVPLSNLQSLLSCTPEKLKSSNTQDLAKYQKTLETFLEWQRYQSQLMESQMKNSKSMLSGFPADISGVAAATAFSQMLWLPYLNQFDFSAPNRDFMSPSNPILMNDYSANCSNLNAPPQINTNHISQPSPFLTPTSPMELESHLKTLAMWQEALMMQQNPQYSRACTKASSNHQDMRRGGKFSSTSHSSGMKKSNSESSAHSPRAPPVSPVSSRSDTLQTSQMDLDFYQDRHASQSDFYKKLNRQSSVQQRLEHQQKCKSEIQNQYKKSHQNYSNYQTEFLRQCKSADKSQGKKGPNTGGISVKPLSNLVNKNSHSADSKNLWEQLEREDKTNLDFTSQVASKLQQFNTQIQRTTRREEKPTPERSSHPAKTSDRDISPAEVKPCTTETPKIKVKNLVDPNKSPPKLLKRIAPEHLPIVMNKGGMQDDGQANVWHPLFGSSNRMHVMEEGNGKVTADAAELPGAPPDLPKRTDTVGKAEEPNGISDSSSPVFNGLSTESKRVCEGRSSVEAKSDFEKEDQDSGDGIEAIKSFLNATANLHKEVESRGEEVVEEEEKDQERSLEPQDLTVTCTSNFENLPKASQNEKHYSNNKVISISVEQCQTNSSPVNSIPEDLKKPKPVGSRKRSNRSTDSEESFKTSVKRSKFQDVSFDDRERTVSEYVEKAAGSSLEELQMNTEKLQQEIHSLSALARAKELEWNDIIRLKKVKEEIYLRLVRRKQVMLLSMSGSGRASDSTNWDFASENRMSDFVTNDEVSYNRIPSSASPKPPPRIPSNLTITKSQNNPNQNLQRFLMQQPQNNSDSKSNGSLMMVPMVSSTPLPVSSTPAYIQRPHLPTPLKIPVPDRDKLKGTSTRNVPIPILPKPNQIVNHVNNHSPPIGRQGPIVDVKSIIADYRQNHPEQVPRRGRRPKSQPSQNFADTMMAGRGVLSMSSMALGSGAQVRTVGSNAELTGVTSQNSQESSRPSSADSNRSSSNAPNEIAAASGVSFKDVLVQFAKMSQHQQGSERRNSTPPAKSQLPSKAPPYPEVTLHPVLPADGQSPPNPSSSLLHGILTKNNGGRNESQLNSRSTTFSPTLARLLTTPDKSSISTTLTTTLRGSSTNTTNTRTGSSSVSISDLLSTSKPAKQKEDVANTSDEDPEDNSDRLVIDESEEQEARREEEDAEAEAEADAESVPECQGCHVKSAQFVCAGCGNQWYCSRSCQVTAWDEHSEVCSG